jgi:hypothetical protein
MTNPLKLSSQIAPPDVSDVGRATKITTSKGHTRKSGPLKISPSLLAIFDSTVKSFKAGGESGNQIGTQSPSSSPKPQQIQTVSAFSSRRTRVKIKAGVAFGDLTILRKGPKVKASRPNLVERWRCRCSCGKEIIVPRYYLLRKPNPKTHCGCKVATLKSQNPREYRIYMMIHQRCYNPNHNSYEHYRSRGITLHEPWHNKHKDGFKKFFEHVGSAPSQWHSLDRIHNNKGYEPGNLRWATAEQQRANQGDRIAGWTSEEIADAGYTEDEFIEKILSGEIQG